MASVRKKLDEKNLKILRDLLALPGNKHCFDCNQRGPTYVNVTIGSFVCTTCSGMLRGLTPPHRVKSITMATFSQDEIDSISARGNEYCRKVWLGLSDANHGPPISYVLGNKDEQSLKDYMVSVYERKRFYVNPSDVDKINGSSRNDKMSAAMKFPSHTSRPNVTDSPILSVNNNLRKMRNNNTLPPPVVPLANLPSNATADPFAPVGFTASQSQSEVNFANFDNNPVFANSSFDSDKQAKMSTFEKVPPPPSEDRYAALKDLDCQMKSQLAPPETSATSQTTSEWGQPAWTPNFDESPQMPESSVFQKSSNPFSPTVENGWAETPTFGGNPFKSEIAWPDGNGTVGNGLPVSQSLNFNQVKSPWDIDSTPNPFHVNGYGHPPHHSSNPFL
ncbi:ArfGap [Nesidiocoris tenuis]|uniref:ArfGap n=1 Tax=Nesidiocoris tenuis TaxID=355587 RepID=A0ABN7ADA2_9HEMI|nr:ArfGap [Nesidiocoris tenuis]